MDNYAHVPRHQSSEGQIRKGMFDLIDESGRKYGKFTILNKYKRIKQGGSNRTFWLAECECGEQRWLRATHIRNGKAAKMCRTCSNKNRTRSWQDADAYKQHRYKQGAEKRNLPFELTEEQFRHLIHQPCHYCGRRPTEKRTNGIDRRDNKKGYTVENSLPCCTKCNFLKGRFDYEVFIKQAKRIASHVT